MYIGIKSNPVKGQANKEIIKKIAKHFGVSFSLVQIKSGHRSREKVVRFYNRESSFCLNRVSRLEKICQKLGTSIILISHFSK